MRHRGSKCRQIVLGWSNGWSFLLYKAHNVNDSRLHMRFNFFRLLQIETNKLIQNKFYFKFLVFIFFVNIRIIFLRARMSVECIVSSVRL